MGKYLDFYKKCMETRELPKQGLCHSLLNDHNLSLFTPTGDPDEDAWCWGYDGEPTLPRLYNGVELPGIGLAFTDMRQNVVLFMAAMADEDFSELSL